MKRIIVTFALILSIVAVASAQKFAVVDTKYILENIPEYDSKQSKLNEISLQWQQEIEEKLSQVDKMYKDYQAEGVFLTEEMKRRREDEIMAKEKEVKELQKRRFGVDGDLYKKRQELIKPLQDKVYNAIKELAEARSYAIVFDKSSDLTILFANERYDLSEEVLEKLGYGTEGEE